MVYLAARRSDGRRSEDQPGAGGRTQGSMGAEQTNGVREVGPGGQGGPGRAGPGWASTSPPPAWPLQVLYRVSQGQWARAAAAHVVCAA